MGFKQFSHQIVKLRLQSVTTSGGDMVKKSVIFHVEKYINEINNNKYTIKPKVSNQGT